MEAENKKTVTVRLLKTGPPNDTTFVLGGTGKGKTTVVAHLLFAEKRFVCFDAKGDYYPEFFGDCKEVSTVNELAECLNDEKQAFPRVIFRIPSVDADSGAALNSALEFICKFQIANVELGPITISVDELNRYAESNAGCPFWLQEVIQRGRDYGGGIKKIFGAQWFGTIPPYMRDSFSEIYAFKHTDKNALNILEQLGFDREQVKALQKYTALHLHDDTVELVEFIPAAGGKRDENEQHRQRVES